MSMSISSILRSCVHCAALFAFGAPFVGNPAWAQELPCQPPGELMPISGKIFNNAVGPGETLGTMHGVIPKVMSTKCGIHGVARFNPDASFAGFTHTMVCDEKVESGSAHSQVVALTVFAEPPNFQSCGIPGVDLDQGTFREISYPFAGRGSFSPTGGGKLVIDGTLYCTGAVDMRFSGHICVLP